MRRSSGLDVSYHGGATKQAEWSLVDERLSAQREFHFVTLTSSVERLVTKFASRSAASYLDVYALGFTNDPRTVPTLVGLVKDSEEAVRLAAVPSLGTLRAVSQPNLLKDLYANNRLWPDRAMALKAIAGMDTIESNALAKAEPARWGRVGATK